MVQIRPPRSNHRHLSACFVSPKIAYQSGRKEFQALVIKKWRIASRRALL